MNNTTNVLLRVTGILGTLGILIAFHHVALLIALSIFLPAFVLHVGADLVGDKFFLDEPGYVAFLRWLGFESGIVLAAMSFSVAIAHIVVWLWLSVTVHLVGDAISVKKEIMAFNIQALFDKITGRAVRFIGLLLALTAGIFVSIHFAGFAGIGYLVSLALAALNWVFPVLGKSATFNNFADAKYWPTFVLLGIAVIFIVTGWQYKLAAGAVFTILDGIYFSDNPGNY